MYKVCCIVVFIFIGLSESIAKPPAQQKVDGPYRYALVIGVKGYPNYPEGKQLSYTDADARLFAEFIQTEQGGSFPRENVRLLLNDEATRKRIYEEIGWLSRNVRGNSIVYFFFAGHGYVGDSRRAFFMPYEASESNPEGTAMRAEELLQTFSERVNAKHMLFFVDACYSGAAIRPGARGGENITSTFAEVWEKEFKGRPTTEMGFFSARPNQRSFEDQTLGHGLFTYYLVEALKGSADSDPKDGRITASETQRYVTEKVENASRAKYSLQSPIVSVEFATDFPLAFTTEVKDPDDDDPDDDDSLKCAKSDGRNLMISVIDEFGLAISGADVMLIFSDGTFRQSSSRKDGRVCVPALKQNIVKVFSAHSDYSAFHKEQHDAKTDLTVQLRKARATGSALCDGGWCHIPGWTEDLNPHSGEDGVFFYMKNVSIGGQAPGAFTLKIGQLARIENNEGSQIDFKFVANTAQTFLYEFTRIK